jgi:2-amino-4-hydroxy-6-hydroxymethyldihydropteridine diphosphokinase
VERQNIHSVYLALGTNLGRRQENLKQAIKRLAPDVRVLASSKLYETVPAYVIDQPAFLNIVVKGETKLSPQNLLVYLKRIEDDMGREHDVLYGPRIIDLDIIFYDDWVVEAPNLQIPHLRLAERGFVLYPLVEIAAEVVHPVIKKTVMELADNLPVDDGIIRVTDWKEVYD